MALEAAAKAMTTAEPSATEYTDRYGADALKTRIEAYWRERGFDVQVMLVEGSFTPQLRACRVDVRSDLVNGLPRMRARTNQVPAGASAPFFLLGRSTSDT